MISKASVFIDLYRFLLFPPLASPLATLTRPFQRGCFLLLDFSGSQPLLISALASPASLFVMTVSVGHCSKCLPPLDPGSRSQCCHPAALLPGLLAALSLPRSPVSCSLLSAAPPFLPLYLLAQSSSMSHFRLLRFTASMRSVHCPECLS